MTSEVSDLYSLNSLDDSIDVRSFTSVTDAQVTLGRALAKTIQNAHKFKLRNENSIIKRYKPELERINPLLPSAQSSQSIGSSSSISSIHTLPIKNEKELKIYCWEAFQKYATVNENDQSNTDSFLESSKLSLQASLFPITIEHVTGTIPTNQIMNLINTNGIRENDLLNWNEYIKLCSTLLAPYLSFMKMNLRNKNNNDINTNHTKTYSNASTLRGCNAYDMLIRKQRGISYVNYEDLMQAPSEGQIIDVASESEKKDAICEVTKLASRKLRNLQKITAPSSAPNLPGTALGKDKKPHFIEPLIKDTVAGLVNPNNARRVRCDIVKQGRRARDARVHRDRMRKAMLHGLNCTVIASDRSALNKVLTERSELETKQKQYHYLQKKEEEAQSAEAVHQWQSDDLYQKSMSASSLRYALSSSSSISKTLLEFEKNEKNALKAARVQRFSDYTTFKVDIPEELQKSIKYSKKLSEFRRAKKLANEIVTKTMSERIERYAQAKKEAIIRATAAGGPVAFAPIRGTDYFYDDGELDDNFDDSSLQTGEDYSTAGYYRNSPTANSLDSSAVHGGGGSSWHTDADLLTSFSSLKSISNQRWTKRK